jgi:hypothetical protein
MTHHQLNRTVDNSTLSDRASNLTLTVQASHFSTKPYYTSDRTFNLTFSVFAYYMKLVFILIELTSLFTLNV